MEGGVSARSTTARPTPPLTTTADAKSLPMPLQYGFQEHESVTLDSRPMTYAMFAQPVGSATALGFQGTNEGRVKPQARGQRRIYRNAHVR
jgi:hypothetical protein